jgi:hypothetical protein
MKSFLQELAEKIHATYPTLSELTLIFPNRRASLYFRKHLSNLLHKPSFAPTQLTIEDFISQQSSLQVPDKLELIHCLYKAYQQTIQSDEPFDQFYFWGEMLLRDFDEVDKYLVNAEQLFKDLSHQKEIDSSFDFLTDEQLAFLKSFWDNFDESLSANKKKFLHIWRQLPTLYNVYKKYLKDSGYAFDGMLHREVAEQFLRDEIVLPKRTYIFVGFNALTKAEEAIITKCIERYQAEVYWDIDSYYVNNNTQEAGRFFREYQQHSILGKTFTDIPSNFNTKKEVRLIGAPQHVGQAKIMTQILEEELIKGMNPEETLLVLPDEKLMLPVLHGTAAIVDKLNVTMGFSLGSTPLFNLIELLLELQLNIRSNEFNHRQVINLLAHPYIVSANTKVANEKRKAINKQNKIHLDADWLQTDCVLHQLIFSEVNLTTSTRNSLIEYFRTIIIHLGSLKTITDFDKEYCFHFLTLLNRLEEVIGHEKNMAVENKEQIDETSIRRNQIKAFQRLFRQVVRSQKIPFTGEPLRGLQLMGVLETRNIDFKNVFILSLNEGALPSGSSKGSYIPHTIRRAYAMPTVEHQDAIYAYLFYRVLQRAENVFLYYNTETDILGQGEMSRYLQQLLYESGWNIKSTSLHNAISPHAIKPIEIKKDQKVMDKLRVYLKGHPSDKGIHPTSLIDYLQCRLRFYLKHIAYIREASEVEDEMDARILGSFVHSVMEFFYTDLLSEKRHEAIEADDLRQQQKQIASLIDRVFIETYKLDPNKPVEYDGQRLVVREITHQFADRIIEKDIAYAPFHIEGIERDGLTYTVPIDGGRRIVLKGIIDRIDRKGKDVRVIDYKTGKDDVQIKGSITSLFSRTGELNKAAFQTLFYALLYKENHPEVMGNINAGIFNRNTLFSDSHFGMELNGQRLNNVSPLLPEFEQNLQIVLQELYNPDQSFDQTTNLNNCKNCPYQTICYR